MVGQAGDVEVVAGAGGELPQVEPHGAAVAIAEGVDGVQLADVVGGLRGEGRGVEASQVAVGGQGAELPGERAVDHPNLGHRSIIDS